MIRTLRSPLPTLALILCAALPLPPAQSAAAQEAAADTAALPDWVPAPAGLPADARVTQDSAVGSFVRMATIEVPGDPKGLLSVWRDRLREEGYTVEETDAALADAPVVFSGKGIRTGQVVRLPGTSEAVTLIQIDVTLEN